MGDNDPSMHKFAASATRKSVQGALVRVARGGRSRARPGGCLCGGFGPHNCMLFDASPLGLMHGRSGAAGRTCLDRTPSIVPCHSGESAVVVGIVRARGVLPARSLMYLRAPCADLRWSHPAHPSVERFGTLRLDECPCRRRAFEFDRAISRSSRRHARGACACAADQSDLPADHHRHSARSRGTRLRSSRLWGRGRPRRKVPAYQPDYSLTQSRLYRVSRVLVLVLAGPNGPSIPSMPLHPLRPARSTSPSSHVLRDRHTLDEQRTPTPDTASPTSPSRVAHASHRAARVGV
eukprot:5270520-Prymnesium_polylepis.1